MKTLPLTSTRHRRRRHSVKYQLSKNIANKNTKTNSNPDFIDPKTAELILKELKEKTALEEKKKEINKFCIKIALFVILGLGFIYLKFTLF